MTPEGLCQFVQVLHTPFGGCIQKITDAAHFQCAAFDFQQVFSLSLFHVKINAGFAVSKLRPDKVKPLL